MALKIIFISIVLSGVLGVGVHRLAARASSQQQGKPVEELHKNIQVLKGLPSSQLLPVMHFMRTSLGVRCDYCHVAENGKYWMDDKTTKQTARKMLQMVFDINKTNFEGEPVVTCNSCHRGSTQPLAVPAIGQGAFTNTTSEEPKTKTVTELPSSEQVFDRYIQALGGSQAIKEIKTRVTKITLLRPKVINAGTSAAVVLNRGEELTMETYQKLPDKYLAVIASPGGAVFQGFNGTSGWTKNAQGQRKLNGIELLRLKGDADLHEEIKLQNHYSKIKVIDKEKIGERHVYVLEGRSVGAKTERLYFDVKSGLLVRRTVFTELKLGLDPEQMDYEDYRQVDGVWLPFRVRTSYLDDNHFGTTRIIREIKQNVQIEDSRFEVPHASRN